MAFTLLGFAEHLAGLAIEMTAETHIMLEIAARIVETEAKAEIGVRQGAAGPFAAWEPLADSTIYGFKGHPGKEALGFPPPDYDPLLREGDMRDSIKHVVIGETAHVGSDDPIAVYQELGTVRIPPRSFLGGAAFRKKREIGETTGRRVYMILEGNSNPTHQRIP